MDAPAVDTSARTTESSKSEGRLIIGAGCSHGKKKCLKCVIKKSKKDGKGGSGIPKLNFPISSGGFGGAPASSGGAFSTAPRTWQALPSKKKASTKLKSFKSLKFKSPSTSSLFKRMKLGKAPKAAKGLKMKSLKHILKGY
jgi:hypothetical protein